MSVTIGQQLSDILRRKVEGALVISGEMVATQIDETWLTNLFRPFSCKKNLYNN